jgi:hypothetical protein
MADVEHLSILARGRPAWLQWRAEHPEVVPDLERADLSGADLGSINLSGANLVEANLAGANLVKADLVRANLLRANLSDALLAGANLGSAILGWTNLSRATLWMANLGGANLIKADLSETDLGRANLAGSIVAGISLRGARLQDTVLTDLDLGRAEHLISCRHEGPSSIDHRTLERSGTLPLSFLRGCGLSESYIESLPGLLNGGPAYEPCFIRATAEDRVFAERLWADLQHEGVRCWSDADPPRRGATVRRAIGHQARVLLVLSESSVKSDWIEAEVEQILGEEHRTHRMVLVPVRVDDAFSTCAASWVERAWEHRPIRDFSEWQDRMAYRGALSRLLCDLETHGHAGAAVTPLRRSSRRSAWRQFSSLRRRVAEKRPA